MYTFGVDAPYGDQWDAIWPLFVEMRAGTLDFADFYAFHNEHRIFFPRLVTFALAALTQWNIRAELLLIWILACLCAANIWRLAVVTGFGAPRNRVPLLLAANVLLFTPVQWENLLWGFQIGFFLPLACMSALPWAACSLRRPLNYLITLGLCLISTFSIASGFAAWLLAAPLLILRDRSANARGQRMWQLLWLAVAVASVAVYFPGYKTPRAHPGLIAAVENPRASFEFFLAYLGNPFSSELGLDLTKLAELAGMALLLPFFGGLFYLVRWRKDGLLLRQALPWISLSSIALLNAFLTMLGRVGFGVSAALQSRYVSFAVMLPIGLIFLGALIWNHWRERKPASAAKVAMGAVPLAIALAALFLCATIHSLKEWRLFQHDRLTGKTLILLNKLVNEPAESARYVHWDWALLQGRAESLDRLDYLRPRPLQSAHIREIAFDAVGETMGKFERFGRSPTGDMAASGWAILPQAGRVADSVVLTYENQAGDPIIFARADVGIDRDDIIKQGQGSIYRRCGWRKKWKANDIPADTKRIGFWAFDAEDGRAFSIGSVAL